MCHRRVAVLLLALIAVGCQAEPSPTARMRTMTVTIAIPVPARGFNREAEAVFSERLTALGIREFGVSTVSTDDSMRWTIQVPIAIDDETIEAVLHRAGLFQFVPWPAGHEGPAPGDAVPAGLQPLFDDPTPFESAAVTADSAGQPAVDLTLDTVAREAIATYTRKHIGSTLPFVLDGFVLTAPIINGRIAGGVLRLTGPLPAPISLAAIVAMIASGPLPAAWR
jgi:hypothetical protein